MPAARSVRRRAISSIGIPTDFSDVQVTVSWDTDADLDLHVADPTR